ncbi:MAG: adenosine deaminase [Leptospiraceae bacterium]|nr:adenosine deaminase [Leptospiraceae bacterium]
MGQLPEELIQWICSMPKVELHIHLEGATAPSVYWELANRNGVNLPATSLSEWEDFFSFRNFEHFINVYATAVACLKSPSDYYFLTERFLAYQASQNVHWTEAFISLSLIPSMNPKEFIKALQDGIADGFSKHGTRMTFIADISRHQPDSQRDVLNLTIEGYCKGVFSGLGLGGIEQGFTPDLFKGTFSLAKKAGLYTYAHAGETTGPETVRQTIDLLKVERIGHGFRVLEDPFLTEELVQLRIPFEVCPNSNYALGLIPIDKPHPIRKMVDLGLLCTINSDDPAMFSTSLNSEYLTLASQGFTREEIWQLNLNGFHSAKIPNNIQNTLYKEFASFRNGNYPV